MSFGRLAILASLAAALWLPAVASAQAQHAHVHGQLRLDIAVDGPTIVIAMDSPLDNLVGFERAPRSDAERKTARDAIAMLKTAERLFVIDPAANCKRGTVELVSATLGLGKQAEATPADAHADLDATFTFDCSNAAAARYVDVGLFAAFKGTRQIDAQIVSPQGQFQRSLQRPATRLAWGR